MTASYLLTACRTPIGKFLGSLATVPAPELAAAAIRESLSRSGLKAEAVNEVILGNVLPAGLGQAPARQAALAAGLPPTIAAATVKGAKVTRVEMTLGRRWLKMTRNGLAPRTRAAAT